MEGGIRGNITAEPYGGERPRQSQIDATEAKEPDDHDKSMVYVLHKQPFLVSQSTS